MGDEHTQGNTNVLNTNLPSYNTVAKYFNSQSLDNQPLMNHQMFIGNLVRRCNINLPIFRGNVMPRTSAKLEKTRFR